MTAVTSAEHPPPFDVVEVRTSGHPSVRLIVRGELDLWSGALLQERLAGPIEDGDTVLIDLRGVTFLDSSGVRTLIAATTAAPPGALSMVAPSGNPMEVLQLCGIIERLPFVDLPPA